MSWILEGKRVIGKYMGVYTCTGIVTNSRVAYGGTVKHIVTLDDPIEVFGELRYTVILNDDEIEQSMRSVQIRFA
jgi:hypothetical protein